MIYFQSFRIEGDANAITYDDGLKSTESEPKRLKACHIQMNTFAPTDTNEVQGWHERAKVFDIPEKIFPSEEGNNPSSTFSEPRSKAIPVELDIPVGEIFRVAIKCGASGRNLRGAYEYEIIS